MSRGLNSVVISGNVSGRHDYSSTQDGTPACSFRVACDRHGKTVWIKVNAYGDVTELCRSRLEKGGYVVVLGELVTREGRHGDLLEVRAKELIFR